MWSRLVIADDYPQSYIARQLEIARTPVKINLAKLRPGLLLTVEYVGMPVFIYLRTDRDLAYLARHHETQLADPHSGNLESSLVAAYGSSSSYIWARLLRIDQPDIEKTRYRSLDNRVLVVGGWGPQSGCVLAHDAPADGDKDGSATFRDPCVGAVYDAAGRVLKGTLTGSRSGQTARYNLYVPPYTISDGKTLTVGWPRSKSLPDIPKPGAGRYAGLGPTQALIMAARYDDLPRVRLALEEGADANYFKPGDGSPLDAAIIGSSIEVVKLLIANGASPTTNSLAIARLVGRPEVVELIQRP